MIKITKEYLEQNINLEEIHKAMEIVDKNDESAEFKIGDIPVELDYNYFNMNYSLAFSNTVLFSPSAGISKDDTVQDIARKLYDVNINTKLVEFMEIGFNVYTVFSSLFKKYGEGTKFEAFGAQLIYDPNYGSTIVYIDDLVIPCSKYLDCELEDFTITERYPSKINMLEAAEVVINYQKA